MNSTSSRRSATNARGVLFDMDGVLLDSERLKAQAHSDIVARYGGRLSPRQYRGVMGRAYDEVITAFIRMTGIPAEQEAYSLAFRDRYIELLRTRLRPTAGAEELLADLRTRGYRLALVSSSLRWMMDEVLARIGLGEYFGAIVSAEDVNEEKPSPEPYRLALARLSLPPENAVVFEDSRSGVIAGRRAGVPVIAIRHEFNIEHDFVEATAVLDGLADVAGVLALIERVLEVGSGV